MEPVPLDAAPLIEAPPPIDPEPARPSTLLAPWWHTAVLVAIILSISGLGMHRAAASDAMASHHVARYLVTMAAEWILAGLTWIGLRVRRVPLRQLFGPPARWDGWLHDIATAVLFWFLAMVVIAAANLPFKLMSLRNGHGAQSVQEKLVQLAPDSFVELCLWIALCISAGICEELIFRGYLQQQFARASGRVWVGVLGSALIFGAAHGYEGWSGMLNIALLGLMFSLLVVRMRSLRAAMMAHAWFDMFQGFLLILLKHLHTSV